MGLWGCSPSWLAWEHRIAKTPPWATQQRVKEASKTFRGKENMFSKMIYAPDNRPRVEIRVGVDFHYES